MFSDDAEGYDDGSETEVGVVVSGSGRGHGGFATGMAFIVLAIVLNFALDAFSADEVADLPWFIALAFESGGKMGVTVVLCGIGVMFILWDLMIKADVKADPKASFSAAARHGATRLMARRPAAAEEPPPGAEAMAEEIPEAGGGGPKKIPAMRANFGAGRTGGPVGDANPGPLPTGDGYGGAVVLTTAKYLNAGNGGGGGASGTSGRPGFRKGRTNHTQSD